MTPIRMMSIDGVGTANRSAQSSQYNCIVMALHCRAICALRRAQYPDAQADCVKP
jgi:hypothetical protein